MKLNDLLQEPYEINGKVLDFDLSFDNVLDILEVLNDSEMLEVSKLNLVCSLLVENDVQLTLEEKAEVFAFAKKKYIEKQEENYVEYDIDSQQIINASDPVIDLEQDASYIYASFRQIGINLFEQQGKLTWMEFNALLEALPDDCIMSKIISIRTWKSQKGDSPSYKKQMKKLKAKYALKPNRKE